MHNETIIRKPVVTEKATALTEHNQYVFEVARAANKIQVRKAVEELFDVKVTDVRTMRVKGKPKRMRMNWFKTPERKKAIVTLKEGDVINII